MPKQGFFKVGNIALYGWLKIKEAILKPGSI